MQLTYSSSPTRELLNFHRPGPRLSYESCKEGFTALWSGALEAFVSMFTTQFEKEQAARKNSILDQTFTALDSYEKLNFCGHCFRKISIISSSSIIENSFFR